MFNEDIITSCCTQACLMSTAVACFVSSIFFSKENITGPLIWCYNMNEHGISNIQACHIKSL
jgi:hypothetical protein